MYEMNDELISMIDLIKNEEFTKATIAVLDGIKRNVENAALYNLLGAIAELKGDRKKAGKFYRVAYYMDQTFSPASNNLSRVADFYYVKGSIDYGVELNHEKE